MKPGSLEHACELIDLGFAVFPLAGKHPLCSNGFKDAVTSKEQAEELWSRPLADGSLAEERSTGVGIATGALSGVWVLDIDNKEGKACGDDTIEAWVDDYSPIPCAWEVQTPSQGRHLYFKHDPFNPVGTRAGVGPGIDVRGEGGYVVGPGSEFEGKEYVWEFSCCPDEFETVYSPPDWLLNKVKSRPPVKPVEASNSQLRELLKDGTLVRTFPDGKEYWRRPGKVRGEHSAVYDPPSSAWPEGMVHVFTDSWPGLPEGTYGMREDDGADFLQDIKEVMVKKEVEKNADGFKEWDFVDLKKSWEAGPLDPPTILAREDGVKLCYPGKLNYFFGPPESLAGSTHIGYQIGSAGKRQNHKGGSLERLFHRFHGIHMAGKGNYQRPQTVQSDFFVPSMDADGHIFMNKVLDVLDSGMKEVFEVRTRSGATLRASADHLFFTGCLYEPLVSLSVGDTVFAHPKKVRQRGGRRPSSNREGMMVKNHPRGTWVRLHHLFLEAHRNGLTLSEYVIRLKMGKTEGLWFVPEGHVVHHKDENPHNNALDNLELLTDAEHRQEHLVLTKERVAYYAEPDEIISIRSVGVEHCYDISVGDSHNFVAGGVVVHNCGKSWAAQVACFQAVRARQSVVYLDFENDPRAFVDRLATLGLSLEEIEGFIFYINPSNMLRPEYFEKVQQRITTISPAVIVVDGVSNSMSFVPGPTGRPMSPLVHDDNLYFETRFLKVLLKNPDGSKRDNAALIAIDHTPKNDENATIFGGQHKKAQIDGASFFFSIKTPFGRERDGRSMVAVDKDKPGHVRHNAIQATYVGDLAIYSRNGQTTAQIELPMATAGDGFLPHEIMEKMSKYINENPGATKAMVFDERNVQGPAQWKEVALRSLKERGLVRDDLGRGGAHWCDRIYNSDLFANT